MAGCLDDYLLANGMRLRSNAVHIVVGPWLELSDILPTKQAHRIRHLQNCSSVRKIQAAFVCVQPTNQRI